MAEQDRMSEWDELNATALPEYEDDPTSELQLHWDEEGYCREVRIGAAFRVEL
jgi:hypothetical protein